MTGGLGGGCGVGGFVEEFLGEYVLRDKDDGAAEGTENAKDITREGGAASEHNPECERD